MTEEEKEAMRDKKKWDGYVPPASRRPPDEFFDLSTLKDALRIEVLARDSSITLISYSQVRDPEFADSIIKYLLQEGKGTIVQNTDDVYYRHETRHDNGQLVDFSERRKVDEKFEMKNPCFHDHYKIVMRTMHRGDVAYIRFPHAFH